MNTNYSSKEIVDIISQKIKDGIFKHDEKIPTERELMEEYDVSRTTIRNVISELLLKRVVYRIPAVGVFVEKEIIRKTNRIMGFTELIKESGRVPKTKVINFTMLVPDSNIQDAMMLEDDAQVYFMERCRYVDDKPFLYEYVYIDPRKIKNLENFDFNEKSLYEILRDEYDIKLNYLQENISAVTVDHKISDFLYQTSTAYALKVEGLSYDYDNEVVEYGISYYHAQDFSFESVLVNIQ